MIRILVCLILLPVTGFAQQFRFTHLNQYQGLSQNTVTAVLRDSEGLIWIGTQDGLNLFDGYKFNGYFHSQTDTTTISDNYILCLAEDQKGRIWIGTRNGICYYEKKHSRFFRYYNSPSERLDYHNAVNSIYVLKNGDLQYRNKTGEHRLQLKENASGSLQIESRKIGKEYEYHIGENRSCILYNSVELKCRDASGNEIFSYPWKNKIQFNLRIQSDAENLFLTDSLNVQLFNLLKKNEPPKTIFKLHSKPTAMLLDKSGMLWIGTQDGLYVISNPGKSNQSAELLRASQDNPFSLSSSQIESIYQSDDGLIWIGNIGGGADIYDPLQNDFRIQLSGTSDGISRGPVWMSFCFGKYLLSSSSSKVELFSTDGSIPHWWKSVPSEKFCTAAFADENGWLWIGTRNEGLIVIDTLTGKKQTIAGTELIVGKQVMDIREAPDHRIWICTVGGIFRSNTDKTKFEAFSHPPNGIPMMKQSYFSAVRFDENGNAWVASNIGLMKFINGTNQFVSYENSPGDTNSLSYNILTDICIDSKKRIWVSTISGGFDLFLPEENRFISFSTEDGLPNNTVYGIEEDKEGKLWLSTNAGIVCFDPSDKTFQQFTSRDGLPSNEFVIHSHSQDREGRIYFGSAAGLVSFFPNAISHRKVYSRPVLTRILVNNLAAVPGILQDLSPDERNISMEFTLVDYRFQDKIRYAYQLAGFDPEWRENSSGNRVASYTNLPYGDYVFRVRFKTNGGEWSESVLEIPVHIQTPFWATWWFRISAILLLILLLGFSIRYFAQIRLRKRLQELELAGKIQSEKERISRDLHDNVGAQLTYIISSLDHVSYRLEKGNETEPARKKVEDLGEYARYTMQQLRESIWAINSESIKLSEIMSRLQEHIQLQSEYLEQISIKTERTGEDAALPPVVSIEAFRILQEGISNIFRHSNASEMNFTISNQEEKICFVLTDNGKGFDPSRDKTGHYGLKNMRQRAEKSGLKLEIESIAGSGTKISLEIEKRK